MHRLLVVLFVIVLFFLPVHLSEDEVVLAQSEPLCESPYLVSPGESLSAIAQRCRVRQADLLQFNPDISNAHRIYAGQRLVLPTASSTAAAPSAAAPSTENVGEIPVTGETTYMVKRGDTLGRIAAQAGLSVDQVMFANPAILDPNRIYPGQQLRLPAVGSLPNKADWRGDRIAASIARQQNGLNYQPKSERERWIHVDLATQTVHAYEGSQIVRSFIVSTGKARTPTVTGTYPIWIKLVKDDMRGPGYNLKDVPYVMYFYRGYGLHGTYWHNNFGTPMSAGCVNLVTEDAEWLFDFASVGTIVNVQ